MRIFLAILFVFAAALPLRGADVPFLSDEEKSAPAAVVPTGKLLELRATNRNNRENTPPGALAALAAKPGVIYEWTASPNRALVTGGADLADAFLAPDESLLVLLEKVGGLNGPNSTRILCWNLRNNFLVRAFELPKRKLCAAAPIPGSAEFVASQRAQEAFGQPDRFVVVNLRSGEVSRESKPFSGAIRSFVTGADRTFATVEGENNIFMIPHDNFTGTPKQFRTLVSGPRLLLSPGGGTLVVYGKGRLEVWNTAASDSGIPELVSSRELPPDFQPVRGLLPFDNADTMILAGASGKAMLLSGGELLPIAKRASEVMSCRAADRELFLGIDPKESICLYRLPNETTPSVTVSPGEMRPHSRGRNFRLFALSGSKKPELILIDNQANIFRLTVLPRRWRKQVIFTQPK